MKDFHLKYSVSQDSLCNFGRIYPSPTFITEVMTWSMKITQKHDLVNEEKKQ